MTKVWSTLFLSFLLTKHEKNFWLKVKICSKTSFFHKVAVWVSSMYQSRNKYKNFENQVMNSFMDVAIGKRKIKNMKNIVFKQKNLQKSRRLVQSRKNMVISFCIIFFAKPVACNDAQKNREFQEKTKKFQNHEGSCNLGKTF